MQMPDPRTFQYKGKERTLAEISKMSGVKRTMLYERLVKLDWSIEEATGDLPPRNRRSFTRYLTVRTPDGPVQMSMTHAARYRGIKLPTLSKRLTRGWTEGQALGYDPPPLSEVLPEEYEQMARLRLQPAKRRNGAPAGAILDQNGVVIAQIHPMGKYQSEALAEAMAVEMCKRWNDQHPDGSVETDERGDTA